MKNFTIVKSCTPKKQSALLEVHLVAIITAKKQVCILRGWLQAFVFLLKTPLSCKINQGILEPCPLKNGNGNNAEFQKKITKFENCCNSTMKNW